MSVFIDTNVLVYAIDPADARKQEIAQALVEQALLDGTGWISTQVMQEFFSVITRPQRTSGAPLLAMEDALEALNILQRFNVVSTSAAQVATAARLMQTHQLQWWDALIVEAALRSGTNTLCSEDGHHGRQFGGLTVVNPFVATPA